MKWFNLILVLIVFGCSSHSDISSETIEVNRKKVYKGFINDKYPITMELTYSNENVTGKYCYDKVGQFLTLKGTTNELGEIKLSEFDSEGNKTGEFNGVVYGAANFEGEWKSDKKQFNFKLIEAIGTTSGLDNVKSSVLSEGDHKFSFQFVSWDKLGTVKVTSIKDNRYRVVGEQRALSREMNLDGENYITIDGVIEVVSEKELKFNGLIKYYLWVEDERCVKEGEQVFKSFGKRKYWRMRDKSSCNGSGTNYIDIYF